MRNGICSLFSPSPTFFDLLHLAGGMTGISHVSVLFYIVISFKSLFRRQMFYNYSSPDPSHGLKIFSEI